MGVVGASAATTVARLIRQQCRVHGSRVAIEDGKRSLRYAELEDRTRRLATVLAARGVGPGDRIALLSENRLEVLEVFVAAARLGAICAVQSWRLAAPELAHCMGIAEPRVTVVSERHERSIDRTKWGAPLIFGAAYESAIGDAHADVDLVDVEPEAPFLILYTSGTTGLPKGAVISHRAEIVRNLVVRAEFGVAATDTFVAWSPLFHMGAAECALGTLMCGGKVMTVDGFDAGALAEIVARERLGWLLLMPGMVGRLATTLADAGIEARGVRLCGVMADLVPRAEIAAITRLLDAPYANTFGATETGCPPCSSNLIPVGEEPVTLSKEQSPYCEIRLVDADDCTVPDGNPGELCMRGPTLFSGYWRDEAATAHDFRGGWFHMGDVFVRNPDGTLDFVDRVKYLIKSGGENIYPAEIERILLADPRVADATVVRQRDARWGEVPIAFVARRDRSVTESDLAARLAGALARHKHPKHIHFIGLDEFPRSASGKIRRDRLEAKLEEGGWP